MASSSFDSVGGGEKQDVLGEVHLPAVVERVEVGADMAARRLAALELEKLYAFRRHDDLDTLVGE